MAKKKGRKPAKKSKPARAAKAKPVKAKVTRPAARPAVAAVAQDSSLSPVQQALARRRAELASRLAR